MQKIRKAIEKEFPEKKGWKFLIENKGYMKLQVSILEAPIPLTKQRYEIVSHNNIKKGYANRPLIQNCLLKINEIIRRKENYFNNDNYFNVAFYYGIEIGLWNKPFRFVALN